MKYLLAVFMFLALSVSGRFAPYAWQSLVGIAIGAVLLVCLEDWIRKDERRRLSGHVGGQYGDRP